MIEKREKGLKFWRLKGKRNILFGIHDGEGEMAGEGELRRESDRIGAPRGDGMAPNGERRRRRRRNEEENKKGIFLCVLN